MAAPPAGPYHDDVRFTMRRALIVTVWAVALGLGPGHRQSGAQETRTATSPVLTAEPNPVPDGPGLGKTTIAWDVANNPSGEVQVSENGGPWRLMASGARGATAIDWIKADSTYVFRLVGNDPDTALASLRVTRKRTITPLIVGVWIARAVVLLLLMRAIITPLAGIVFRRWRHS